MKRDKGTAGLNVLLSVITLLFVIGLIVMIFALMGGALSETTFTVTPGSLSNETIAFSDGGTDTSVASFNDITLSDVVITNATGGEIVPSTNYTITGGVVTAEATSLYNASNVRLKESDRISVWSNCLHHNVNPRCHVYIHRTMIPVH